MSLLLIGFGLISGQLLSCCTTRGLRLVRDIAGLIGLEPKSAQQAAFRGRV